MNSLQQPSVEVSDYDSLVSETEAFNVYSENLALQAASSFRFIGEMMSDRRLEHSKGRGKE